MSTDDAYPATYEASYGAQPSEVPSVPSPAVTLVRIEVDDATGHLQPTTWKPVGRLVTADRVVLNTSIPLAPTAEDVTTGYYEWPLMATDDPAWDAPWCWEVREGRGGRTRHVLVPTSTEPLPYAGLQEVDPTTFAPVTDPGHGLWLGFRDLARRVAAMEAGEPVTDPIGTTDDDLDTYVGGYLGATLGAYL